MKTRKHGHSWHKRATLPRSLARPVLLVYRVAWRAHNNPHKHHRAVTRIRAVSSCSRVIERAAENADTETLCEAYHICGYASQPQRFYARHARMYQGSATE